MATSDQIKEAKILWTKAEAQARASLRSHNSCKLWRDRGNGALALCGVLTGIMGGLAALDSPWTESFAVGFTSGLGITTAALTQTEHLFRFREKY
ncbi:MAG: hypothetical protein HC904_10955 [Blastochloris sp.]|nr:hypothetical protein [Blastochloris sp.]